MAEAESSGYPISELALCDFNGDGFTDVMRTDGTEWFISSAGTKSWASLNKSGYTLPDLAFADIDGDGDCDALAWSSCLSCEY